MSVKRASLLVALALALSAEGAFAAERERVVVFPLDGELSSSDRRLFDAMLLSDLRRQSALELVPEDVRQVHVEATRSLGLGCASGAPVDAACAAEVGTLAAAKWAIVGEGALDRTVRLRLIAVDGGAAAAEVSTILPPPGESFTPALRALVPELLEPTAASRPSEAASGERGGAAVTTEEPLSPAVWWISGGALIAASALSASAAAGSFVAGAAQEGPLKAGDDPDTRFATRDAWYAGGVTLAVIAGASLLAGAGLAVFGLLQGEAPSAE